MLYSPAVARCAFAAVLVSAFGACTLPGPTRDDLEGTSQTLAISGVTFQTVLQKRFVGAENNGGGAVNATATLAQAWEKFSVDDINGGTLQSGDRVHIRAGNGQLFQAVNGGGSSLNAASNNTLDWETFALVKQTGGGAINNGDIVGLQAFGGSWVSAQDGGGAAVFAYGGTLGPWEQFTIGGLASAIVPVGPTLPVTVSDVNFRTTLQSRYVGAVNNGGGAIIAMATTPLDWETFSLVDLNGNSLESGDAVNVRAGGSQFFQALNGGGSTLSADGATAGSTGTFKLVRQSGSGTVKPGDVVGLQTSSGNWVSAENGGGGAVFAYGGALGPWESLVFGIGRPAAGPTNPGSGFASILDEGMFNGMFPARNGFYTYAGLVNAAATFGAFANSGDIATRKREVAAFLANVGHETGDLVFIEEINKADYCAPSGSCPCAPGKRYFGRGPLQLSWNFNYCTVGAAIGIDLRADPDRVARDPTVAWQTGLWFWMTSGGAGFRPAHDSIVNGNGFGETIRTINGSLECNGGNPGAVQSRINRYRDFCSRLGVDPGGNQGC